MNEKHRKAFEDLKENADSIRELLKEKKPNLALLDKLIRQRNELFLQLTELFNSESPEEDELQMVEEMIHDNNSILEEIEAHKKKMETEFHKKEIDASKISRYSTKPKR